MSAISLLALFAFFPGGIGPTEMIIFGIIAVLLFGNRLPEVGKSLGKGLIEFKKGLRGIEDEIHQATTTRTASRPVRSFQDSDDRDEPTAPKFEPPTSAPRDTSSTPV